MGGKKSAKTERKSREYNVKFLRVVYLVGMITMLAMAVYTMLAYFVGQDSFVRKIVIFGVDANWILAGFFAIFGLFEFFANLKTRGGVAFILLVRILSTLIFANFVSFDTGISFLFWMILLITCGLILGWLWMIFMEVIMIAAIFANWFFSGTTFSADLFLNAIAASAAVIAAATLTVRLREIGVVQIDVYDRLKTREKIGQRRLETIINSLSDAVLGVDKNGKINFYNSATLSLMDTNKDLSGKMLDEFFELTDENGEKVRFAKILAGVSRNTERQDLSHVYADGEKIDLQIEISPVRQVFREKNSGEDGGGLILVIRDITKQKSLDDERDEFISVVSHELRTPVAIAEGSLSNLQLLLAKNYNPKLFSSTLNAAHDQILYLGKMVNDLSTLSRDQRGVYMDPEKIDIREFLEKLYTKYLPEATKRKLKLDLDIHASGNVNISRMALEEILQNLITNALKYTARGGVTIGVKFAKTANGNIAKNRVEFSVKDTGIGISITDQKHVYERFWRSEDFRTRETGGTGLGLHIVEQLAAKIGTKIELKSRINYGSTFSFVLPVFKENEKSE